MGHLDRKQAPAAGEHLVLYDIIRACAMLLVVIGHSSYYTAGMTPFGGIDYVGAMRAAGVADTAVHQWADFVVGGIYTFHMRVFFALSGAVFYLRLQQGAYQGLGAFLRKKARRLLLPFFLVVTLYVVPLKALGGCWAGREHPLRDMLVSQYLLSDQHLWFLLILFWSFCAIGAALLGTSRLRAALLRPRTLRQEGGVFFGTMLSLLVCEIAGQALMAWMQRAGLGAYSNWGLGVYLFSWGVGWMTAGMTLERLRQQLPSSRTVFAAGASAAGAAGWRAASVLLPVLFIAGYVALGRIPFPGGLRGLTLHEAALLVVTLFGVAATFLWGWRLSAGRAASSRWVQRLSRDSMGIYLYSDPLNYVLLALFASQFGIAGFGVPALAAFLLAFRFLVTLLGSWGITLMLRRISRALQLL